MFRFCVAVVLLLAGVACTTTTTTDSDAAPARATLTLVSISPAAGETIDERTVMTAEIQHEIENFQPGRVYYLMPQFDSVEGPGRTFNALDGMRNGVAIRAQSGTSLVRYPVKREFSSWRLARPVNLRFFLVEQTGRDRSRVIGSTEMISYSD
jgi:hypothetical protein